eukprot:9482278-Pyramimonas_sp.AAC.3
MTKVTVHVTEDDPANTSSVTCMIHFPSTTFPLTISALPAATTGKGKEPVAHRREYIRLRLRCLLAQARVSVPIDARLLAEHPCAEVSGRCKSGVLVLSRGRLAGQPRSVRECGARVRAVETD